MTTIKDYARDLVLDTIKLLSEKNPELDLVDLSQHEVDDLVDDFIKFIIDRIIGD